MKQIRNVVDREVSRGVGHGSVFRENPRLYSHHQFQQRCPHQHHKMYQKRKRFKVRRNYYRHQCRQNQPQENHYQSHHLTQIQLK